MVILLWLADAGIEAGESSPVELSVAYAHRDLKQRENQLVVTGVVYLMCVRNRLRAIHDRLRRASSLLASPCRAGPRTLRSCSWAESRLSEQAEKCQVGGPWAANRGVVGATTFSAGAVTAGLPLEQRVAGFRNQRRRFLPRGAPVAESAPSRTHVSSFEHLNISSRPVK